MKTQLSYDIGRLIIAVQQLNNREVVDCVGELSPSELHVIDTIGLQAVTPSAVANRLHITRGAVTQLVNKLVDKDIVTRSVNPQDKRSSLLMLTTCGQDAYREHLALHDTFIQALHTALPTDEALKHFTKGLHILTTTLEEQL